MFCNTNFIANLFLFCYNYNKHSFENYEESVEERKMALNDVEESQPYTMGRLIAGARNKKISHWKNLVRESCLLRI